MAKDNKKHEKKMMEKYAARENQPHQCATNWLLSSAKHTIDAYHCPRATQESRDICDSFYDVCKTKQNRLALAALQENQRSATTPALSQEMHKR